MPIHHMVNHGPWMHLRSVLYESHPNSHRLKLRGTNAMQCANQRRRWDEILKISEGGFTFSPFSPIDATKNLMIISLPRIVRGIVICANCWNWEENICGKVTVLSISALSGLSFRCSATEQRLTWLMVRTMSEQACNHLNGKQLLIKSDIVREERWRGWEHPTPQTIYGFER